MSHSVRYWRTGHETTSARHVEAGGATWFAAQGVHALLPLLDDELPGQGCGAMLPVAFVGQKKPAGH